MLSLKDLKIVIIGGGGFIGHNLALSLKKNGACVELIDSLQVNNLYAFGRISSEIIHRELYIKIINERLELLRQNDINLHLQDARDFHALAYLLNDMKPDVVIQLAAVSHANKSNKDPYSTFDHSLRTLENALDNSRGNIQHFIYFSSSMVYGHFNEETVDEEKTCNPLGIYGALKYAGEKLVIAYNQVFDLPYTIIRPSALYGERCVSRRVGQIFLENAVQGKDIVIHGNGKDRLDFTYIDDLTQGVIKIIQNPKARNETFNLTFGQAREIGEMAEIVRTNFPEIQVNYIPKDRLTPDRGTLSIEKAKEVIGYAPSYPLERGYQKYIDWYRHFELVEEVI